MKWKFVVRPLPCLLLVICGCSSAYRNLSEIDYLTTFVENLVSFHCHGFEPSEAMKCTEEIRKESENTKLGIYLRSVSILHEKIENLAVRKDWRNGMEGSSLMFFEKVKLLQQYAIDKRVETICEIGFNAGYSALNFLVSNPIARIVSFDILSHDYSSLAIRSLQEMFKLRDFIIIGGASNSSVPRFHRTLPAARCNLILIDGSHTTENLRSDLYNMRALANFTFHRVLVDDIEVPQLSKLWDALEEDSQLRFVPQHV